jgi:hypothetical protein
MNTPVAEIRSDRVDASMVDIIRTDSDKSEMTTLSK